MAGLWHGDVSYVLGVDDNPVMFGIMSSDGPGRENIIRKFVQKVFSLCRSSRNQSASETCGQLKGGTGLDAKGFASFGERFVGSWYVSHFTIL